jgi:hypothetical protein
LHVGKTRCRILKCPFALTVTLRSVLLTIDYAVVKGVFGAIGEIAGKAKATAQQIVAGLVTLGGIVLCRNPTLDTVVQTFLELSDRRD